MRAGNQRTYQERAVGEVRRRTWEIEVADFGLAITKVVCGDMDGSGEAPGVQLEFEHEGCPGGAALAMGGHEAELVARALTQAASKIKPSDRVRARRRRWQRSVETSEQPARPPAVETIELGSSAEATALAAVLAELPDDDPRKRILADVIRQVAVPF